MAYINRNLQPLIKNSLDAGKVVIVFGARQVGKTTLLEKLLEENFVSNDILRLNGDDSYVREMLSNPGYAKLKAFSIGKKVLFIDEAQRIPNIGITLKIFADRIKDVLVMASGSSALELASGIKEPLTGRKLEFVLLPLSFSELSKSTSVLEECGNIERRLVYGSYPEIVVDKEHAERNLKSLAGSYLYKDLLVLENIRKPVVLDKLLRALALQIGGEISFSELASLIGVHKGTIERYIDLLEKAFVIFTLPAFYGNVRNEIKKGRKIYFYDCGIRNAVLGNFTSLEVRNDVGALWENYVISERVKMLGGDTSRSYFWRSAQKQEIDYVETLDDSLKTLEIKWNPKKKAFVPKTFSKAYPKYEFQVVNRDNYWEFLLEEDGKG